MTAHDCTTHNPACPRCDLSRAEVEDDFTEAAREAADEYDDAWFEDDYGYVAFEIGAQWARTHLAAQEGHRRMRKYADDWDTCTCGYDAWPCRSQEPNDAEVEAARLALHQALAPDWMGIANVLGADQREYDALLDELARAALSAARAARRDEATR